MSKPPRGEPKVTRKESTGREAVSGPLGARRQSPNTEDLLRTVGRTIMEARKARKLSQKDLARLADVPTSTVFTAEQGMHNMSLATLQKIADALKLQLRDLMPGADKVGIPPDQRAKLKMAEGALRSSLTEMGRTSALVGEVLQLVEDTLTPPHLKDQ